MRRTAQRLRAPAGDHVNRNRSPTRGVHA
jgi:hypothetical protein